MFFFLTTDDTLYRAPDNFVAVGDMYVGAILHPSKQDQRAVIQFLGAEGCQPVEIYHRMQACVSKTIVNDWSRQFRQGLQSTAELKRLGRSRMVTTPANIAAVRSNRRL